MTKETDELLAEYRSTVATILQTGAPEGSDHAHDRRVLAWLRTHVAALERTAGPDLELVRSYAALEAGMAEGRKLASASADEPAVKHKK